MPTITHEVEIEVEAKCNQCGAELDIMENTEYPSGQFTLSINPCETCLDKAKDKGHDEGYESGKEDGLEEAGE